MKKSNKLLLAGFLILLLFITVIHVTLYAKYKSGNYTVYHESESLAQSPMQLFPNVLYVSMRNVSYATVIFSDVAKMERDEEKNIEYVQKGDTLQITGGKDPIGFRGPTVFHLPSNVTLVANNSSLSFRTGQTKAPVNPVLYLQGSRAEFSGTEGPLQMGHLKIVASDGTVASFNGTTKVDQLEVQLSNAVLQAQEGDFGQVAIVTDSLSHISLQSKILLKADIKTSTPQ